MSGYVSNGSIDLMNYPMVVNGIMERWKSSNQLCSNTVAEHADVTLWDEMDDSKDADSIDGLFWRQTLDPFSGKLSVYSLPLVSG